MFQQLDSFFQQHFAFCAGKFGPGPLPGATAHACTDLLAEDGFDAILAHYSARNADIDRRAVLSVWSMYLFSHLSISPVVLWLMFRQRVALEPGNLGLCLDAETGLPSKIIVTIPDALVSPADMTVHEAMSGLVFDCATPLVERLAREGLSPRLLWSNFAVYVDWIVRAIGDRIDPDLGREGLSMLDCAIWPDGRPNPMHGLLSRVVPDDGEAFTRRRVCCLRYLLPGTPGCGMICPLPSGRA